jgi:hypothetical protein
VTVAAARNYSSTAVETTISSGISGATATFSVAATTGFPTAPFAAVIDRDRPSEEAVLVTGVVGLSVTVTRGYDSTAAVSHDAGAEFTHSYLAIDAREAGEHVGATSNVHGTTGALVGSTQVQTLTNKTLTSPTINGGTVSSATISASTLAGIIAGSPEFSGTPSFSGTPIFDDIVVNGSVSGAPVILGDPSFTGNPTFSGDPSFTDTPTFFDVTSAAAGGPFGAWADYTPTLSSNTGATPTIGSGGTRLGRYCRIGKTAHVAVDLTYGTSPTQPGDEYRVGLPFTVSNATGVDHHGPLYIVLDLGTRGQPNLLVGVAIAANGTNYVVLRVPSNTIAGDWNSLVNSTFPLPFLNGETLRFSLTLEVA